MTSTARSLRAASMASEWSTSWAALPPEVSAGLTRLGLDNPVLYTATFDIKLNGDGNDDGSLRCELSELLEHLDFGHAGPEQLTGALDALETLYFSGMSPTTAHHTRVVLNVNTFSL